MPTTTVDSWIKYRYRKTEEFQYFIKPFKDFATSKCKFGMK